MMARPPSNVDWSEVSAKYNYDISKIDAIPLDVVLFDNPVYRTDKFSILPRYHTRKLDEPTVPPIDHFPLRTLLRRQLELEQLAAERQSQGYIEQVENVAELGRAAELGPLTEVVTTWHAPLKAAIQEKITKMTSSFEKSESNSEEGAKFMN